MSASIVATTASSSTRAQLLSNNGTFTQSIDDGRKTLVAAPEKDENERTTNDPLPTDLRKILSEVARTGASQSLPWTQRHQETGSASPHADLAATPVAAMRLSSGNSRRYFNRHRVSSQSPCTNSPPFQPTDSPKPRRNGLHLKRRRLSSNSTGVGNSSRVFLIRTSSSASASSSIFSQASAGAGRNSGSEIEDSTQYECDSEGTSATSASERSVDRREQRRKLASIQSARLRTEQQLPSSHSSLKDVVRAALELVLDHWYRRFGYNMTSAEKRMKFKVSQNSNSETELLLMNESDGMGSLAETVFKQRRQRLLGLLLGPFDGEVNNGVTTIKCPPHMDDGTPFTIQRIAEVLIAPEKYYTKTHKLCNCLEKLLLVTSSSNAFGGSSGGEQGHGSQEELDATTWADELEGEGSPDQLKQTVIALPTDDVMADRGTNEDVASDTGQDSTVNTAEECSDGPGPCNLTVRETTEENMREEAARLARRTKFDHDPHILSSTSRDGRLVIKSRGLTSSPPPPSLSNATADAVSNSVLTGHGIVARQKKPQQRFERSSPPTNSTLSPNVARSPSPILFSASAATESASSLTVSASPQNPNSQVAHIQSSLLAFGTQVFDVGMAGAGGATNGEFGNQANAGDGADLENEPGRSSASNSDVDSESDDISLDDSASDRSDGSDSGTGPTSSLHLPSSLHEPFTAARVLALSRMHQQQQLQRGWLLQQTRGLASLNTSNSSLLSSSELVRHQAEVGYQSGDSIDSMIAEDSGGSDSSSSDFAD